MRVTDILKTWRISGSSILIEYFGGLIGTQVQTTLVAPTWVAAGTTIDCSLGDNFIVTLTANTATTYLAPTNIPLTGRTKIITITIANASGVAHGAQTMTGGAGGYRTQAAIPAIATGNQRTFAFRLDQTSGLWNEVWRTAADVLNA